MDYQGRGLAFYLYHFPYAIRPCLSRVPSLRVLYRLPFLTFGNLMRTIETADDNGWEFYEDGSIA